MASEKLYYIDAHVTEFEAVVVEQTEENDGWRVVLDRTAFYPGGGGQPEDRGTLDDQPVIRVSTRGNEVIHHVRKRIERNRVKGKIDENARKESIQQHTGQHIVSACLMAVGGYNTVSVHMGDEFTTIECDISDIPEKDLVRVEARANRTICRNLPVHTHLVEQQDIHKYNLRRPAKPRDRHRIVEIEKTDWAACGGVHAGETGEVGLIQWAGTERIRGHVRSSWLIGDRAYRDYRSKTELIAGLVSELSTPVGGIFDAVVSIKEQMRVQTAASLKLEKKRAACEAARLLAKADPVEKAFFVGFRFDQEETTFFKELLSVLSEKTSLIALLLNAGESSSQMAFCAAKELPIDAGSVLVPHLELVDGRGGGKGPVWQGVAGNPSHFDDLVRAVRNSAESILREQEQHEENRRS